METLKSNKNEGRLSGKKPSDEWIVDFGASHHMTGNIKLLIDAHSISACPVGPPNGENTSAMKEGSLALGGNAYFRHVLFVPILNCTLISVSKTLHDLDCTVTFTNNLCVIQDRASRTLIGAGELCGWVYQFRAMMSVRANKVDGVDELELWHRRLGHPSRQILSYFSRIRNRVDTSRVYRPCDNCFLAKQTREIFNKSSNKAVECFSLAHGGVLIEIRHLMGLIIF